MTLGSLKSEDVFIEFGDGDPEELGVEEGGGVIWGLWEVGGPSSPGGRPPGIGDCHAVVCGHN